ncbi:MAG: Spy/CpxP family protein refolding chaperone [Gammaproteobacteria bacterium]
MNKKILTIALAISLPLAVTAYAGGGGPDHFGKHRGDRVERLTKELDLTAEQKTKLEAVFQQEEEKRKVLREETHRQMQEFLSPEQMTKLEELRKQRYDMWKKRHEERRHQQPEVTSD